MITGQVFTKCIHELPDYTALFWVNLKNGCKTIAKFDTHSNSFDVRGVISWCELDD